VVLTRARRAGFSLARMARSEHGALKRAVSQGCSKGTVYVRKGRVCCRTEGVVAGQRGSTGPFACQQGAACGMQKAIRLGLAVDEQLTTSGIGAYISYPTATYWLAEDKGAGTVDLSQAASAKAAATSAVKVAKPHQSVTRTRAVSRARSAANCYTSSMAESMTETLHGVAEEAIGSAATVVGRLRPEGAPPGSWSCPWFYPWLHLWS
jgi:hypothetical protein